MGRAPQGAVPGPVVFTVFHNSFLSSTESGMEEAKGNDSMNSVQNGIRFKIVQIS